MKTLCVLFVCKGAENEENRHHQASARKTQRQTEVKENSEFDAYLITPSRSRNQKDRNQKDTKRQKSKRYVDISYYMRYSMYVNNII